MVRCLSSSVIAVFLLLNIFENSNGFSLPSRVSIDNYAIRNTADKNRVSEYWKNCRCPSTAIFQKNEDEDEKKMGRLVVDLADKVSLFFSYIIQFLGVLFTLGLVLNIFGYAYSFDLKNGLEIDTLENRRKQVQFQKEMMRSSAVNTVTPTTETILTSFLYDEECKS